MVFFDTFSIFRQHSKAWSCTLIQWQIFLIDKEIQKESDAKSYMANDLLWLNICAFPHILGNLPHKWLCNRSHLNFLIYKKNFIFFIISVHYKQFSITRFFSWSFAYKRLIFSPAHSNIYSVQTTTTQVRRRSKSSSSSSSSSDDEKTRDALNSSFTSWN